MTAPRQRLHIIAQAEQLYVENGGDNGGFENTTVEAIAERSDISLRTFFRYFESKQDVIYLDSAQALLDLEKFTRARLESETPAQAALNGRLDQIRHFCSSKASRARMRRSLRSPEFRDGLNKMRGKIEAKRAPAGKTKTRIKAKATEWARNERPHFHDANASQRTSRRVYVFLLTAAHHHLLR